MAVIKTPNEPDVNPDAGRPDTQSNLDSGKVVRYIGMSDVREINEESWLSLGSKAPFTRWNARNKFMVDAADLDDAALDYLELDPEFAIVDAPVRY